MGIIDRLGDVIRSYLNDEAEDPFERSSQNRGQSYADPDMEVAFEELDDYLQGKTEQKKRPSFEASNFRTSTGTRSFTDPEVPESLRQDFAELGVSVGASPEVCKAAYKKLLKIHHPDRHAGHPGNMKKATEKSARINAAFDRIEQWRQTGKTD
ncbi:MAG: J domain-containing protein [Treponema sp.]|jgi:DnaJ-domain-containing protein 1|nr:J domain-containing protein [Treponema sp.]